MWTLDDKILGEKAHYYCSSSEDEDDKDNNDDYGNEKKRLTMKTQFISESELNERLFGNVIIFYKKSFLTILYFRLNQKV